MAKKKQQPLDQGSVQPAAAAVDPDEQIEAMNRMARLNAGNRVDDPHVVDDAEDLDDISRRDLPQIELPRVGRTLGAFARDLGNVCKCNGVYRRDIVPVVVNPETNAIVPLTPEMFRTYVEDLCITYRGKQVGDDQYIRLPTTMPKDAATGTLQCRHFVFRQKELSRVNQVQQPVLRNDGRIELLQQGYDAESGIYTQQSDIVVHDDWDLPRAVSMLKDMHAEFDFADSGSEAEPSRDLSAHIAAMVSFYGASLLPPLTLRLGALYNANSHRSGKTLLFKIATAPVVGSVVIRSKPRNDDEFRKMLDTAALGSSPYVVLDDVGGNLKNNDLNSFMTSVFWGGRVVYTQSEFRVLNRSMVFITGHNLTVESDLAGRLLQCKLHLEEADVRHRRIRRVIDDEYLAKPEVRSDICSALWTLIWHWDKAGRPKGSTIMGGFERWCATFSGIVENAGFGDPCRKPPDDESADAEFEDMLVLVAALAATIEPGEAEVVYTFPEVVEKAIEANCFTWIIDGKWRPPADMDEKDRFEANARTKAILGKLFADKYGGRIFQTPAGDRVRFGHRGKNRSRKYVIAYMGN